MSEEITTDVVIECFGQKFSCKKARVRKTDGGCELIIGSRPDTEMARACLEPIVTKDCTTCGVKSCDARGSVTVCKFYEPKTKEKQVMKEEGQIVVEKDGKRYHVVPCGANGIGYDGDKVLMPKWWSYITTYYGLREIQK